MPFCALLLSCVALENKLLIVQAQTQLELYVPGEDDVAFLCLDIVMCCIGEQAADSASTKSA